MKTFVLSIIFVVMCMLVNAQVPESFNYQAIPRNGSGGTYPEQAMSVQISILTGSPSDSTFYTETFSTTTTSLGLLNLHIGQGTPVSGTFSSIKWDSCSFYLKVEIDPAGGTNYVDMGITQLLSVPYALNAKTAETLTDKNAVEGNLITYDGTNWVAKNALTNNSGGNQSQNNMQPYLVLNYCIALVGIFPSRNAMEPFIGEIQLFGFNFPPRGFASCDGQLLPINQNSALFALLGITYGGDGRTTFGLPDLRGRVPIHYGNGPGLTNRPIGQKSGTEYNTMTISQMPSHSHTIIYQ